MQVARNYREINGVGRCSVTFHGESRDGRTRLLIAQETATRCMYAVIRAGRNLSVIPVTSLSPGELLELLDRFELSIDPVECASARSQSQLVSGR
jgi:hypothetical protein